MDGIAETGGTPEWGPVPPPRADEPVFAESWQGRAFTLALLSSQVSGGNVDAFRHSLERLDRAAYLDGGYYARWLNGGELMLTDSEILAPGAVDARARNLRGEHVEEPPIPEPAKLDYAPTAEGPLRGPGRHLVHDCRRAGVEPAVIGGHLEPSLRGAGHESSWSPDASHSSHRPSKKRKVACLVSL
ncbi:hypothetical protein ABZV67_34110 [Streptomyces sp. NPDC005065]|uniref:hypothetical protein n=1 Tax=Streptomyces sp. NPDC005065 TaxID=3154461 RepID=UPI0033B92AF6